MALAGKKVYVGPFQKKSERPADGEIRFTNVYVKNLPDSVDDDKLGELFGEFGSVTSAVVMKARSAGQDAARVFAQRKRLQTDRSGRLRASLTNGTSGRMLEDLLEGLLCQQLGLAYKCAACAVPAGRACTPGSLAHPGEQRAAHHARFTC